MKKYFRASYFAFLASILTACGDFQKVITVPLPPYENKLVAECYLEEGRSYRLLLSESVSYFEGARLPDVPNATVFIKHNGFTDTLQYKSVVLDTLRKVYNYQATVPVEYDTLNNYELFVRDTKGRTIQATTRFLPVVPIDSISWNFSNKENETEAQRKAYLLIRFKDNPQKDNYYRITVHKSNTNTRPQTDFFFTDRLFAGQGGVLTGYNYKNNDTLIVSLYHIDRAFYQFLDTSRDAARANGNPFALPSGVISNIKGNGTGVFTALAFDRRTIIIKK
jgi:hypothetical protein